MAGAHDEAKPLISWPGIERERKEAGGVPQSPWRAHTQ
jgi:hypothetical protein